MVVVVLALVGGVGAFFLLRDSGPSHPKSWDARVQPFADIVEKQRNLTFEHPVHVRFLSDKAFEKTVRADRSKLDKDDEREIEQFTSLYRAFGLIAGDVDLFDAVNDATGSGTLAYYSFEDEAITVRGKSLSRATHATLVHELTHALQDQRFDLGDRVKELSKKAADGKPSTQSDALRAILEGDAQRVANLYRVSLSAKERKALEKAETADSDTARSSLEDSPKAVQALLSAPYVLGEALARAVGDQDESDLDRLLREPPPDDSVLLDPLKALGKLSPATTVKIPALKEGEKKIETGQIGSLITYLMLAERIGLKAALTATDAWDGDAYVSFERDGVVCARVEYAVTGDDSVLGTALDDWGTAVGASANVKRGRDRVTVESCDPGQDSKLAKDASTDALELVALRSYVGSSLLSSGLRSKVASCLSRKLLDTYSIKDFTEGNFGADDPAVAQQIRRLAQACE